MPAQCTSYLGAPEPWITCTLPARHAGVHRVRWVEDGATHCIEWVQGAMRVQVQSADEGGDNGDNDRDDRSWRDGHGHNGTDIGAGIPLASVVGADTRHE